MLLHVLGVLLAVCSVLHVQAVPACRENICMVVRCAMPQNCKGRIDLHGGFCGCCPACIDELGEGDRCMDNFLLGLSKHSECGTGLHCDKYTHTCAKQSKRATGSCLQRLHEVEGLLQQHNGMLLGAEKPHCLADDTYAPKQCSGSKCYCVGPDGSMVDGYMVDRWTASDMDCKCARDLQAYMATGLIGKLFFCESNGNYPPK